MPNVYRDKIKEGRAGYFVTYQSADCRLPFASVNLVFLEGADDTVRMAQAMEDELEFWLTRYAVPVMVSAFDAKGDLIHVRGGSGESHLMGYRDLKGGQIVRRWGLFKDDELPQEQAKAEYLQGIYHDVGFRDQATVHDTVDREYKSMARTGKLIVFLVVGFGIVVPFLIELVSLGIVWLGYALSAISILVGAYKVAKALGWIGPSKREKETAELERKKNHYFWHCERNPEAFNRLKAQNFDREIMERTRKEAEGLGVKKA